MRTPIHHGRGSNWAFRAQVALVFLTLALALGTTGCGGKTTANSAITPINVTPDCVAQGTCPVYPGTGTGSGSGGSGSSGGPDEFDNAIQLNFTLNGTTSGNETYTSAPITTDNLLKIRVTALPGGTVAGTNFQTPYSCEGFTIGVLGQQRDTRALAAGTGNSLCPNGGSQVIDFSNTLSPGHADVTITVSNPRYDWYCLLAWYGYIGGQPYIINPMYCPLHTVYKTHTVVGSIEVLTNGN